MENDSNDAAFDGERIPREITEEASIVSSLPPILPPVLYPSTASVCSLPSVQPMDCFSESRARDEERRQAERLEMVEEEDMAMAKITEARPRDAYSQTRSSGEADLRLSPPISTQHSTIQPPHRHETNSAATMASSNNLNETKRNDEEGKEEELDVLTLLAQRQASDIVAAEQRKLQEFERAGEEVEEKIRLERTVQTPHMVRGKPRKREGMLSQESTSEAQELEVGIAKLIRCDEITPLESGCTFASSTATACGEGTATPTRSEAGRPAVRPGAYAETPGAHAERTDSVRFSVLGVVARIRAASEQLRGSRTLLPRPQSTGVVNTHRGSYVFSSDALSVADLVEEDDDDETLSRALTVAEDFDLEASLARKQETELFKCTVIISVMLIAIVPLILLLAYVPNWGSKSMIPSPPTAAPVATTAAAPSQSPSSYLESRILSLLPDATLMALKDESSPQSKAYRWLLDDTEYLPYLSDARILQRFALAAFYLATEGSNWVHQEGWLNHSIHECFWESKQYQNQDEKGFFLALGRPGEASTLCGLDPSVYAEQGVLEDVNNPVMHLWMPQNNLQGNLPPELSLLSKLESIHLDLNSVGYIPSEIAQLSFLRAISMNGCGLLGTVPDFLMELTDLIAFHFGSNSLTGTIPPELGSFPQLRTLMLLGNGLTGSLPAALGNLSLLKTIFLDTNPITGTIPTEFGLMKEVDFLDLREMQLTGTIPTQVGTMTAMYILLLHSNSLTGTIPSEIGKLESVRAIALAKNNLGGGIPSQMGLLHHATHLWIDTNKLTGTVPFEMCNLLANRTLERLWLQGNEFSGSIPHDLCSMQEDLVFDCNGQLCGCDCECPNK